jgi:DNA-binding transcriptional ArsR family regulator
MVGQKFEADLVFHALGDPTRRLMVERLSQRALTVGELAEPLDMSFAGASKHIGVLEKAGLVARHKRGRERLCVLQTEPLEAARQWVEHYSKFWNARLDALEEALREDEND